MLIPRSCQPKFKVNIGFLLLVLLLTSMMCCAGIWQLNRAEQKKDLQQAYQLALQAPVQTRDSLPPIESGEFQRLRIRGHYLAARQFLLENRYRMQPDGMRQVGYEVLTPFKLLNGEIILVNRGWLPGTLQRQQLPDISVAENMREITGTLTVPQSGFRLGTMDADALWPRRLLYIDFQQLHDRLGMKLYPALFMLGADQQAAYRADWSPVIMGPAKHYAYAAQWFLMALASVILFIIFTMRRGKE